MMVRAWDSITRDMIVKSFRVCGQVRDVNVDEITAFQEGRCASDGKSKVQNLIELDHNDIDFEMLEKLSTNPMEVQIVEGDYDDSIDDDNDLFDPLDPYETL